MTGAAVLFQRTDAPVEAAPVSPCALEATPPVASDRADCRSRAARAAVDADELCAMAGLTRAQLADLQSYGVVTSQSNRPDGPFDEDAVEIATVSKRLLDAGLEPRHLRGWRVAADREVGLLEQLIQPFLRQRNPEARAQAVAQLSRAGTRRRAAPGDDAIVVAARRSLNTTPLGAARPGTVASVVPLELIGVRVEVPANTPMLLLREAEGRHRLLPIYIGNPRRRPSTTPSKVSCRHVRSPMTWY